MYFSLIFGVACLIPVRLSSVGVGPSETGSIIVFFDFCFARYLLLFSFLYGIRSRDWFCMLPWVFKFVRSTSSGLGPIVIASNFRAGMSWLVGPRLCWFLG